MIISEPKKLGGPAPPPPVKQSGGFRPLLAPRGGDAHGCISQIFEIQHPNEKTKIEHSHLKDHDMASSTVFTACLYVKRVILCDFLNIHYFCRKMESLDVTKTTIAKKN